MKKLALYASLLVTLLAVTACHTEETHRPAPPPQHTTPPNPNQPPPANPNQR